MERGACVLVADDDPDILNLVRRRLTRDGHEVIAARDGDEARELTELREPDALVLDVVMPGADGVELTRWAREQYPPPHADHPDQRADPGRRHRPRPRRRRR